MHTKLFQSCPTLCTPLDWSLPGSSAHGILQARILEWVACPPPGDFPNPGIKPMSPAAPACGISINSLSVDLQGQVGRGRNNGSLLGFSFTPLFVHFSHKGLSLFTKTWLRGFCFHICAYIFLIWLRLYTSHFLYCYGGFLLFKNRENKSIVFEVIIIVLLGEERGSNDYRAT